TIFYLYIFVIGTIFGSFSSVIIDRLKNNKSGIITGRSECPKCRHKLGAKDLIPIFSFLNTKGKCRYCKSKISYLYPILEISMGILFVLSTYFLIDISLILSGNLVEIYKLCFYLLFSFLSLIYVVYDILYLEIPDSILAILIGITFLTVSLQSIFPNFQIINILHSYTNAFSFKEILGFIGLGIITISGFYFIMLKGLREIFDVAILSVIICTIVIIKFYFGINLEQTAIGNAILGSLAIFLFLFLQILISSGAWMGGGDLRIGILIGLIVGLGFSFHSMMTSYLFGSFVGIGLIIYGKIRQHCNKKKLNIISRIKKLVGIEEKKVTLDTKMPFGPFLALGIFVILFWGNLISEYLKNYL
ncbi:MAG: prepilin peptidase, partial [Candidatus Gracilibacteria bacterium]|nr:prepilin peptidase [Candidatus Gracilibacteria bacterium]